MTRMLHRQDRRCLGPCRTPAKPWLASWTPQAPESNACAEANVTQGSFERVGLRL